MNKADEIITKFETLPRIELSENWEVNLNKKLSNQHFSGGNKAANRLVLIILMVLIVGNVAAFTSFGIKQHAGKSKCNLKDIATEFLITTPSSKY